MLAGKMKGALMKDADSSSEVIERPRELKLISTHWTMVSNPSRFVTRYGAAVRTYLRALLPTRHDADDVEQEFLLQVVERGFPTVVPGRGYFRHYLIAVVRNAAMAHLKRQTKQAHASADFAQIAVESDAEREWQQSWRECVLQNTWNALREHQKKNKGNWFHAVLKTSVDYPNEDSQEQAQRVHALTGQALTAESFRKQRSRARVCFGELLIEEVSRTISNVTPEILEAELRDLDLLKYVKSMLG
jgi:DNA-directed RNA polymerase specialized sigma24 family protein